MNKTSNFYQSLWLVIGQLCTVAVSFVSAAILARYFDKSEYGTYKQIMYIYLTIQSLFTMGLPNTFAYFIPKLEKGQQKTFISALNRIFLIIGALISILLFACSGIIANILNNPELSIGLKIFSVFPLFTLPSLGVEGIYAAIRETKRLAKYQVTSRIFMFVCVIAPILIFGPKYEYAIIGWGVASFLTFIIAMYMKSRPYVDTKKEEIPEMYKRVFSYSMPLLGAFISGSIISFADQFYISNYYGTKVFADYSNGCIEIPIAVMITSAVKTVLLPLISGADSKGKLESALVSYSNAVTKSTILVFPILIFCFVFSNEIITFIYGEQYTTSSIFMKSFIIRDFVKILPYFAVLMALGMSKTYMNMHILGAIYIWVVDWFVVINDLPPYYIVIVRSLFYVACSAYAFIHIYKKRNLNLVNKEIINTIAAVTISSAICAYTSYLAMNYLIEDSPKIVKLIVSGTTFYVLLTLTGKLTGINYLESIVRVIKKRL